MSIYTIIGDNNMRLFNSFQIVASFVAWPYLITWLNTAEFRGASAAFYSACAFYVVAFFFMVVSVRDVMERLK